MAMYEPGVYSGEVVDGPDFYEIQKGKYKGRPGLHFYFLPKHLLTDPLTPLPMPGNNDMPRISIVLWSDSDADKERFVDSLQQLGFSGSDIAEVCAGHTKENRTLVGNEVLCRRKEETRKFTKASGEMVEYDQWALHFESSGAASAEEVDQIAIVEKLRASLNNLIKAKSMNVDGAANPVAASSNHSPF